LPPPAPPAPAVRPLDNDEMTAMLKRGESFIATGDITAARLLLRRVAESGNARAALALGATYDPMVLKQIGILGAQADVKQARSWYEKAAALGSPEAPKRIEQLAQQAR
jgi:TPR repeat protein